jgi:hypothetical protein
MKRLRSKLTYANVMATVAVFIALGGASYAAIKLPKNSVGTKQIKNNAITGAKIKNGAVSGAKIQTSSLGTVPNATSASHADDAQRAVSANTATSATSAAHAGSADNALALGGLGASAYARATPLVPTVATLENGWISTPEFGHPGIAKDQFGIVHLSGTAIQSGPATTSPIFVLPPAYRPSIQIDTPAAFSAGAAGIVRIEPTGTVLPISGNASFVELEGITFQAAG